MLPGVHRVRKTIAGGLRREFWYAWRGGPQILTITAKSDALIEAEAIKRLPEAAEAYKRERKPKADDVTFYGLVTRYLTFMEGIDDSVLAPRTKSDRRSYLDVARKDLGAMELRAFESRKARAHLIKWRDGYQATPKSADERLGAVSIVLGWAADRGEIARNPVENFPRIYKVNRADIIWEPHHFAIALPHAAPEFSRAIRFAALSGLRSSDLIALPKATVGEDAIVWQTGKSRGRRTIVIPITPALRELLDEIPQHKAETLLVSSTGKPWTLSGLAAALRRLRIAALEKAQEIAGRTDKDVKSGLEGLRWHDLRGTGATNFLLSGLDIEDVALIMGWEPERVRQIAARYISGQAMGRAMINRMKQSLEKAAVVNDAVNGGDAAAEVAD